MKSYSAIQISDRTLQVVDETGPTGGQITIDGPIKQMTTNGNIAFVTTSGGQRGVDVTRMYRLPDGNQIGQTQVKTAQKLYPNARIQNRSEPRFFPAPAPGQEGAGGSLALLGFIAFCFYAMFKNPQLIAAHWPWVIGLVVFIGMTFWCIKAERK